MKVDRHFILLLSKMLDGIGHTRVALEVSIMNFLGETVRADVL